MKTSNFKLFTLLSLIMLWMSPVLAQEILEVKTEQALMSQGQQNAYVIEIPKVYIDVLQQNWIKKLQENVKAKVVNVKGELVLNDVVKPEISSDTISIYTVLIQKEDAIVMNVFIQVGTIFFGNGVDKAVLAQDKTDSAIKAYIRQFAVAQYKLAAAQDLEDEQKLLGEMQKEYDGIVEDNEDLAKKNDNLDNEIDKTERSISDLEKQIDLKSQEILTKSTNLQGVTDPNAKKQAESEKKSLEKEKDKMEKDRTAMKNDISDMKSGIEKNKKQIEDNEESLTEKQKAIDAQKLDVQAAQDHLDGIK
jgi:predicted  nucleic acid-binding Zn-ribbon protein